MQIRSAPAALAGGARLLVCRGCRLAAAPGTAPAALGFLLLPLLRPLALAGFAARLPLPLRLLLLGALPLLLLPAAAAGAAAAGPAPHLLAGRLGAAPKARAASKVQNHQRAGHAPRERAQLANCQHNVLARRVQRLDGALNWHHLRARAGARGRGRPGCGQPGQACRCVLENSDI